MAEFKYMPYHNVLEVTEEDYAACNPGSPISTHSGGDTTFNLTATGTRYFICGIPHPAPLPQRHHARQDHHRPLRRRRRRERRGGRPRAGSARLDPGRRLRAGAGGVQ